MTHTFEQLPTVEAFLAQQHADDGPEETTDPWAGPSDPLQSIAESLRVIAGSLEESRSEEDRANENATLVHQARAELADLEDKYQSLYEVLAKVEKIVAKSTSKVSLDVKAAINAWRNPEVPADTGGEEPAGDQRPTQPAQDAPVDEWRAYCRALRPAEFLPTELDNMNRSQIRTFLGIEQPVAGA